MKQLSKIGMFLCIIIFSIIILTSIIFQNNVFYDTNKLLSISCSFLFIIVWIIFYSKVSAIIEKLSKKNRIFFLLGYFLILFIFQCGIAKELLVNPTWDYGVIYKNAISFVNNVPIGYTSYFEYCPNNVMIYLLFILIMKVASIFTVTNYLSYLVILNIIIIDIAIYLLYKVAKEIYNQKSAYTLLFITLFLSPIFLYTPIVYTDTITMLFPILYIYIYLKLKKNHKKNIFNYFLLGLSIYIGYKLKMSCMIMIIALFIHMILNKEYKLLRKITLSVSSIFLICSILFNNMILNNTKFHFTDNNVGSLPFTHYVMMGIEDPLKDNSNRNSYGGYNEEDVTFTKSFIYNVRSKKNVEEIIKRLSNYDIFTLTSFYGHKIANTWGDGTYFAPIKISREPLKNSFLHMIFLPTGKYFYWYVNMAQAIQFGLLFLLIISAIIDRKKVDKMYLYLSIIGLFLFLVIWETRSRYLINYIPIFLLTIIPGLTSILQKIMQKKQTMIK